MKKKTRLPKLSSIKSLSLAGDDLHHHHKKGGVRSSALCGLVHASSRHWWHMKQRINNDNPH
jgi:hypothetical protein